MTMSRHGWVIAVVAICSLSVGCKSDDEGENGMAGASGASGAGGMGGDRECGDEFPACVNVGEDDISCPDTVGPFMGDCAPKRDCCRRASNSTKIAGLCPDEPMTLEYRISSAAPNNQPLSTSLPILKMSAAQRATTCAGDQCLLLRFVQPRAGGQPVPGPGKSSSAIGRYNCDGTFSYYNDTVAPMRMAEGFTDPTRWNVVEAETMVDPALDGPDRSKIAWATHPNRRITTSPFFLPGTADIDWEVATSGFEMLTFDTSEAARDCQGRWTGSAWETPGRYQTFAPLKENNRDVIDSIVQNFCQLLSFSVLNPEDRGIDCLATPRCMPMTEGCKYVKLPDSLCPEMDSERDIFRCHLGALGNVNQETGYPSDTELNCTMTAPTAPLNPDMDPAVSKGQCCDPLGAGTNGLPACNAFRIINEFAAAAAEITTDKKGEFPPICTGL
jgi:hypothetical protein